MIELGSKVLKMLAIVGFRAAMPDLQHYNTFVIILTLGILPTLCVEFWGFCVTIIHAVVDLEYSVILATFTRRSFIWLIGFQILLIQACYEMIGWDLYPWGRVALWHRFVQLVWLVFSVLIIFVASVMKYLMCPTKLVSFLATALRTCTSWWFLHKTGPGGLRIFTPAMVGHGTFCKGPYQILSTML